MKKIIVLLIAVASLLFALPRTEVQAVGGTVDIDVISVFDEDNNLGNDTLIELNGEDYGTKLALDTSLGSSGGFTFAFWAVNGIYRPDLDIDSEFIVTTNMQITAYFTPASEHLVAFVDSNFRVLKTEFVANEGTAVAPGTLPTKPGLVVASTPWKQIGGVKTTLSDISSNIIFMLQYIESDEDTLEINVYDYSLTSFVNHSIADYNDIVQVTAQLELSGEYFQYWEEDGKKVSYESTYKFTALSDRNLKAIYGETAPTTPVAMVYLTNDLNRRDGYRTYMGQFDIDAPYTLVEYGFIIAETETANLTLATSGRIIAQSHQYNPTTNEFVMSFPLDSHLSARAYIVVDNSGTLTTIYSDLSLAYTPTPLATPTGASLNASTEVLTWNAVDNASSYNVYIGEGMTSVSTNSISLGNSAYNSLFENNKNYEVAVVAVSDSILYTNSAMNTPTIYQRIRFVDLIISEYIEGSSSNKYIEIYNGTGGTVDLSDYQFELYSNGALTVTTTTVLSGLLAHNQVAVYKNGSAALTLPNGVNSTAASAINFNGDDAFAIRKISTNTFVDIFGVIDQDPGTAWTVIVSSVTITTLDRTLVRASSIYQGITTNPALTNGQTGNDFTTLSNWNMSAIDTVSNLGSHTITFAETVTIPE
jgi:hypothetical protein